MSLLDLLRLATGAIRSQLMRSFLSVLGVAIAITAVILLSSIGEGTRLYILEEFTQFGTNILSIHPGKTETVGIPGVLGGSTRPLTIEDAEALRRVPGVEGLVPFVIGQARVEGAGRGRSVYVYGVNSEVPEVWRFEVGQGSFLPAGDPRKGASVCVLGPKVKRELFGEGNALGSYVRIAGNRLRVIGVMAPRGRLLGFDIDDAVYVPVARALSMFNLEELSEINLTFAHQGVEEEVVAGIRDVLMDRHAGNEDFTITTQAAMLEVLDQVLRVVTMAVGGIAGISLVVGGIGILTTMWIVVRQRVHEVGLLRSIGATADQVHRIFLAEAMLLSLLGGLVGVGSGLGLAALLSLAVPGLPIRTPAPFVALALLVSVLTGLLAGILPARRAASLHPIEALRAE